jgi:hypothetical protein
MKLAHWHKSHGDIVHFSHTIFDGFAEETSYDIVYGSAIFKFTAPKIARFLKVWPRAIIGGTGSNNNQTIENLIELNEYEHYDYSLYPEFKASIGFSQRGCRLNCKFCVVPIKEGKPRPINIIEEIWRGAPFPKHIHLLDNDFFGQPEINWRAAIHAIQKGGFKICLTQGINIRLITVEAAQALANIQYRNADFTERRIYTAWDNLKDESVFFKGLDTLERAGIPAHHVMAYMLVGFDKNETMDKVEYRFAQMTKRNVLPFPMVFDCRVSDPERYRKLKQFQRWAVTGLYRAIPFEAYNSNTKAKYKPPHSGFF